jgi:hypothetical protein
VLLILLMHGANMKNEIMMFSSLLPKMIQDNLGLFMLSPLSVKQTYTEIC